MTVTQVQAGSGTGTTTASATMSRSLPMITADEFTQLCENAAQEAVKGKSQKLFVTLNHRKVYEVSEFVESHPGGGDLILEHSGTDITAIMDDVVSHTHSESAYEMLDDDYLVGVLATPDEEEHLLSDSNRDSFNILLGKEGAGDAYDVATDFSRDYAQNKFLDLNRPLLWQVMFGKWDKEFYIAQVHKPRHYGKGSAPIFGNFLEPLSKTPWWIVPLLWIPVDMFIVSVALSPQSTIGGLTVMGLYVLGLFIWTFLEYLLHRFLFHLDENLPNNRAAFTLHFLLHGVHHYLPMDPLRLVMPPALLVVLTTPLYHFAHFVFRDYYMALSVFAGAFMGYILYDITHYSLHHYRLPQYFKELKTHHLDHHYKNYELGFGVTSKFWDRVFGTDMMDTSVKKL